MNSLPVLRRISYGRGPMLLVIVIAAITGLIGFAALMGYMFYLTPGPHDRL
jgi:hypothetical protein